jgi:hypothetical protein
MLAHGSRSAEAHVYRWQGGGPWERLTAGLPDPLESMPYAFTTMDGVLFAGLSDGEIYRSDDRGDRWRPVALDGDPLERVLALVQVPER